MYDGPQYGLVSTPGNDYGDDSSQSDTRTYINRNDISAISLSVITGSQ
jgi:hypothetical protein